MDLEFTQGPLNHVDSTLEFTTDLLMLPQTSLLIPQSHSIFVDPVSLELFLIQDLTVFWKRNMILKRFYNLWEFLIGTRLAAYHWKQSSKNSTISDFSVFHCHLLDFSCIQNVLGFSHTD